MADVFGELLCKTLGIMLQSRDVLVVCTLKSATAQMSVADLLFCGAPSESHQSAQS